MQISLEEIKLAFDDLINEKKSREEISSWAKTLRECEDDGNLNYLPKDKEEIIWKGILYLEGVDLKDSPDSYLHVMEDFIEFQKKLM